MPTQTNAVQLVGDARECLQEIRRAMIELYGAIGADPEQPQSVARKLGINRNLSWKVSRMMTATDPFAMFNHLPGQQGFELLLRACGRAGAGEAKVDAVDVALRRLGEIITTHAGGREHFGLTLESMGLIEPAHQIESGRELAFRGNSMIWGVQARTRLATSFLAPDGNGGVTFVIAAGIEGFRRLRPSTRWRLYRLQLHDDKGGLMNEVKRPEEIVPKADVDTPLILREFCSPNMPAIETLDGPEGREYLLPGGEVGNSAMFDCTFGYVARGLPSSRTESDSTGSTAVAITLPAERLIFDIIVHKDLPMGGEMEALIFGYPHGGLDGPPSQTTANRLPIPLELVDLPGSPPAISTPHVPWYPALAARVYERLGWNPAHFRAKRLILAHPPMSSRVVVRWPLAEGG